MRSPTPASSTPSASFSSAISIWASPLPPRLTNATSAPIATMAPSTVWPRLNRFALTDASNSAAKSSSGSVITLPPQHQHLAHALDLRGVHTGADRVAQRLAGIAIRASNFHFDQFVRHDRALDFRRHALRQPGIADGDDRFKRVGTGLQRGALAGRQGNGHLMIVVPLPLSS